MLLFVGTLEYPGHRGIFTHNGKNYRDSGAFPAFVDHQGLIAITFLLETFAVFCQLFVLLFDSLFCHNLKIFNVL